MKFKEYLLNEDKTSEKIWRNIKFINIPISPKFWEETFGSQEIYCFVSMRPNRISSLIHRQHKKNQISTFTDYSDFDIFWGATGLEWSGDTIVAVLKGKPSIKGKKDLWSTYDDMGRRWINVSDYKENYNDAMTSVFVKIKNEIKKRYIEFLKNGVNKNLFKTKLEFTDQFTSIFGYRWWFEDNWKTLGTEDFKKEQKLFNKDKQLVIKSYFGIVYQILKKYKKDLQNAYKETILGDYNEVLCYDYKIQEIIVYKSEDSLGANYKVTKEHLKQFKGYKVTVVTNEDEIDSVLRKYKAKNKGKV